MKKIYRSPRLTEFGTGSELTHLFGRPVANEIKLETDSDPQSVSSGAEIESTTVCAQASPRQQL